MKIYFIPYDTYELSLFGEYHLFRRADSLFQHDDKLFYLYSIKRSLVYYPNLSSFYLDSSKYDFSEFEPIIGLNAKDAGRIIRNYKNPEVYVITPNDDFIRDEISYFLNSLNIKTAKYGTMNDYRTIEENFFEKIEYYEVDTSQHPTIYYQKFLRFINHFIRQYFNRLPFYSPVDMFSMLLHNKIKTEKNVSSKALRVEYKGDSYIAYELDSNVLIREKDGFAYPKMSWSNRYIPVIYGTNTIFSIDGKYYIINDDIVIEDSSSITSCQITPDELYVSFCDYLPQSYITYGIEGLKQYLDSCGVISMYPDFFFTPQDLEGQLFDAKYEIIFSPKNKVDSVIKGNIEKIFESIKKEYSKNPKKGRNLGICPACETRGVHEGRLGFFCNNCDNFLLWNKTIEKTVPEGLHPSQVAKLLKPENNLTLRYRNRKLKLNCRVLADNKLFWSLEQFIN